MHYDKLRLTENRCHIFLRKLRVHTFQVEYAENDSDLLRPLRFFSALLRFTEFNRAGSLSPSKVQLGRTLEFCGQNQRGDAPMVEASGLFDDSTAPKEKLRWGKSRITMITTAAATLHICHLQSIKSVYYFRYTLWFLPIKKSLPGFFCSLRKIAKFEFLIFFIVFPIAHIKRSRNVMVFSGYKSASVSRIFSRVVF